MRRSGKKAGSLKNRNYRRMSAILLSAALAAGLLTGCGGKKTETPGESSAAGNTVQNKQTEAGQKDNGTGEAGTSNTDENGEPLKIKMTVRLFDQIPDMSNTYWQEYQKRTNTQLDVEWIPDGDYQTKLNLILASRQIPEVLVANPSNNLNDPSFINAVQNGAFWDLTDVLGDFSNYPNLKNNVAPGAWDINRIDGRIYGIPQSVPQVQGAPIIREDLVKAAGKEMPATMDELLDVLEAIVDQNPGMVGLVSKQDMFLAASGGLSAAFGATEAVYNEEGGLVYYKLTPAFTDFVKWLRKAYERGVLSKEFSVMKPTQATEMFQSGAAAMMINESGRWCYPFTKSLQEKYPDAVAQFTPALEGNEGYYAIDSGTGIVDSMFISKAVPEEKMLQILDYFERTTTQEFYDLTTYGIEGIHYNVENGSKVMTELRDSEMGSSAPWQVLPLMYNPYMKIDSTAAPDEYNKSQRAAFEAYGYLEHAKGNPFNIATSQKWINVWPKYSQEWAAKGVQAVTGQISMEEYQDYVNTLNEKPEIKEAYLEFAETYQAVEP